MTASARIKTDTGALQERDTLEARVKALNGKSGVNAMRQRAKDAVEAILKTNRTA